MNDLNNADATFPNHFAFYNFEVVDAEQGIWKGLPLMLKQKSDYTWVFFSRKYDRVNSDIDRMIEEYTITNVTYFGVSILLVPREKMLFGYNPPSSIIKPATRIVRHPAGM